MDRNTLKLNIFSWLLIWTAMVQTTVAGAQNFATPGAALQADLHRADPTYAAHLQYFAQQLAGGSEIEQAASAIYDDNGYAALWITDGSWTAQAQEVFLVLKAADDVGLKPSNYLGALSYELADLTTVSDMARLDATLTAAVMAYALDAHFGEGENRDVTLVDHLPLQLSALEGAGGLLEALNPPTTLFSALKQALASQGENFVYRRQVLLNMHRERINRFVPSAGRSVRVNLGTQELRAHDNGVLALEMPVVVGQPDRPTPIMHDRIVSLKFSPDWTVPPSIAEKDIIPIMIDDPQSIAPLGLEVRTWQGEPVEQSSINWSDFSDGSFPYSLYQPPGLNNLLGGVRFSLTNDFSIYMHDSPNIELFGNSIRAESSGCVRVGDAVELARWIMNAEKGWSEEQTVAAMVRGRTNIQTLSAPIEVEFYYSTAKLNAQGQLVLTPDIYGEDAKLAEQLGI